MNETLHTKEYIDSYNELYEKLSNYVKGLTYFQQLAFLIKTIHFSLEGLSKRGNDLFKYPGFVRFMDFIVTRDVNDLITSLYWAIQTELNLENIEHSKDRVSFAEDDFDRSYTERQDNKIIKILKEEKVL